MPIKVSRFGDYIFLDNPNDQANMYFVYTVFLLYYRMSHM